MKDLGERLEMKERKVMKSHDRLGRLGMKEVKGVFEGTDQRPQTLTPSFIAKVQ